MKSHITKVVAMLMTVLMLVSLVPAAALPDLTLPDLQSVTVDSEAEKDTTATTAPSQSVADDKTATEDNAQEEQPVVGTEEGVPSFEEEFAEAVSGVVTGKDVIVNEDTVNGNDIEYNANNYGSDLVTVVPADEDTSAYEPAKTNNENDPFLPGGKAWINLDVIQYGSPATPTVAFSEWSANTSFQNTSGVYYRDDNASTPQDETLDVEYYVFPDVDLIDGNLWGYTKASGKTLKVDNYSYPGSNTYNKLYNGDAEVGYAYNRYDPMQGKWGVTFDSDRTITTWQVNKYVDPTKNSYLLFSTEMVDKVKMSIAVKIGTPIVASNGTISYEYRWYTITDDNPHPDVDTDFDQSTIQMLPDVQISAVNGSPIHNDSTHCDGALTGCIDMTYWLPFVESTNAANVTGDVDFKTYHIAEVSVSTPAENSQASRINYLYFNCQAGAYVGAQTNTGSMQLQNQGVNDGYTNDDQNGWQNAALAQQKVYGNYTYSVDLTSANKNLKSSDFVTDKNGKQCLAITIPVRRWINVAKDARTLKLALVMWDTDHGTEVASDSSVPKATFSVWGNNQGYLDTSSKNTYGVYSNENCLFVSGGRYNSDNSKETPYLIGTDGTAKYATTDFNYMYDHYTRNMAQTNVTNFYDWLLSPTMEDGMVAEYTANASASNPNMYGWVYISALRYVLPKGYAYTLHTPTVIANESSLNSKGASFDGGTGVEPNVNLNTYDKHSAAAFGPLLADSDPFNKNELLPTRGNFYGQVATIVPNNVNTAYLHDSASSAGDNLYAGYHKGKAGFETVEDTNAVILLGQLSKSGSSTPYYYIDYKGKNYWVNGWANTVEPSSRYGNTSAPLLVSGTSQDASLGTLDANLNWSTTKAYGLYQWHRSNGNLGLPNWYKCANNTDLPNTDWAVSANGGNKVDATVANKTQYSANENGHTSVSRDLSSPITMKAGDYIAYDLKLGINDGSEIGGIVLAYTMEINGTDKYVFVVRDGNTSKVKLMTYSSSTPIDDIVFRSADPDDYEGFINIDSFLSTVGATSVKLKAVHLQTCRYTTVALEMKHFTPQSSAYKIELGKDKDGNDVIGESYNVVSDIVNKQKVDGGYARTFYDFGFNTSEAHKAKKIVGNPDKHGQQGWYLEYASESQSLQSTDGNKGARLDPATGGLSLGISKNWQHLIITHTGGGVLASEYSYMYVSAAARAQNLVGAAVDVNGNIKASVAFFVVDDQDYCWAINASTGKFERGTKYDYSNHAAEDIGGSSAYGATLNGAFDLTATSGLKDRRIKSIGLFFQNATGAIIDYYFNYCYLSTVVPSEGYKETVAEREFVHNFYMMDNNPGRYATRYPVFNNPTGKVYTDADRVNPLKIKRGDYFYEGYFYNGLPLDNMYKVDTSGNLLVQNNKYVPVWNETNDNLLDRLAAVWFYKYELSDICSNATALEKNLKKITYYYEYDPTDDGVDKMTDHKYKSIYGYSRWPSYGKDTSPNSQILGYYDDGNNTTGLSGVLVNMFVANNNCLVRSGLQTVKFKTTFITGGGQMNYKGSAGIESGVIANTDNRYITDSPLMGYYNWPKDVDSNVVTPVRYGYDFDGWYSVADPGDEKGQTASSTYRIARFHTKDLTGADTFYAHWTKKDSAAQATYGYGDGTPAVDASGKAITWGKLTNTLKFMNLDGSAVYNSLAANYSNGFVVKIPNTMMLYNAQKDRIAISGWAIDTNGDGKYSASVEGAASMYTVFSAGERVTVTDNITLVPVPAQSKDDPVRVKITLTSAKLYAKTVTGGYSEIKTNDGRGVTVTNDGAGTYTYLNVPRNLVLRAQPLAKGEAGYVAIASGMGWQISTSTHETGSHESWKASSSMLSFVSSNKDYYDFAAYTNMDITYAKYSGATTNRDKYGVAITSYTDTRVTANGQLIAYAQYDLPATYSGHKITLIQSGTMYTSQSRLDSTMKGDVNSMKVTWRGDGGVGTANECAVSSIKVEQHATYKAAFLPTTETNSMNQYYFMLTNTTQGTLVAYTRPYIVYWIDLDDDNKVSSDEVIISYSNYVMKTWIPAAVTNSVSE